MRPAATPSRATHLKALAVDDDEEDLSFRRIFAMFSTTRLATILTNVLLCEPSHQLVGKWPRYTY